MRQMLRPRRPRTLWRKKSVISGDSINAISEFHRNERIATLGLSLRMQQQPQRGPGRSEWGQPNTSVIKHAASGVNPTPRSSNTRDTSANVLCLRCSKCVVSEVSEVCCRGARGVLCPGLPLYN